MKHYNPDNKYSASRMLIPNREAVPFKEKRNKKYSIEMAQSFYARYINHETWMDRETYDSIDTNRVYADGKQSSSIYRDAFIGKKPDKQNSIDANGIDRGLSNGNAKDNRVGANNIDYTIMSPAPRLMAKLIASLSKHIERVSIDAIDNKSGADKELAKWGSWVEKLFSKQLNTLRALNNLPEFSGFMPNSVTELQLFSLNEGFKLNYEAAMEDLLKYVFQMSRWDEKIIDKVLKDLIVSGYAITRDFFDKTAGHVKCEYCDIKYAGVQYSRDDEFENPDYGYHLSFMKISEVAQQLSLKEEKQLNIAKQFGGHYGNHADWGDDPQRHKLDYGHEWDDCLVPVFHLSWIDVEEEKEKVYTDKLGIKKIYKGDEIKGRIGKRDKVTIIRRKMLYQTSWIVDTDLCLSYGVAEYQGRDGIADPVLPYHAIKLPTPPIIPQIIPALNEFMHSWIKFQQSVTMATIDGISIELDSINNLKIGKSNLNPYDVIRVYKQTGILFRKDKDVLGRFNSTSKTIEPIKGSAGKLFDDSIRGMNHAFYLIESVTGINPTSLGSQPDPEQGKAVTEYALLATNDILSNIVKRASILKSDSARGICLRIQAVLKDYKLAERIYEGVIGKERLKILMEAEGHDVRYGIKTHARPTQQEVASLREAINISLQNGRDGKVGISISEKVKFEAMIQNGSSLKVVAIMLEHAEKKASERKQKEAMQNSQFQSQQQQQLAMLNNKLKNDELNAELQIKRTISDNELRNKLILNAVEKGEIRSDMALSMISGNHNIQQPQQQERQIEEQQPQQDELAGVIESENDNVI